MGNILGIGRNAPRVSSRDRAVLELKVQRDRLKQYEKRLQAVLDRELQVAKEQLRVKNHHAARLALSKKKFQEQLLTKVGTQLMTLEQLTSSIEYAMVEQQVLEGLKTGNQVLDQLNKEMRIEDVEKLMDDTADAIAYQKEVSDLLGGKLSDEDEADIMAQLDELVAMEARDAAGALPAVPKGDVVDRLQRQQQNERITDLGHTKQPASQSGSKDTNRAKETQKQKQRQKATAQKEEERSALEEPLPA